MILFVFNGFRRLTRDTVAAVQTVPNESLGVICIHLTNLPPSPKMFVPMRRSCPGQPVLCSLEESY